MDTKTATKLFISFALDLSKSPIATSPKDTWANLQFMLERKLQMEYLASCSIAERTRDFIVSNRDKGLKDSDFILGLVKHLVETSPSKGQAA